MTSSPSPLSGAAMPPAALTAASSAELAPRPTWAALAPAERADWQAELSRWPAAHRAYAARLCSAQQPAVALATLHAARRLMRYRADAAGHLLQALCEPVALAADAVEPLSAALAALPTAHSRAFCERLPRLAVVVSASGLAAVAGALVRLPSSAHSGAPWLLVLDAATSLAAWAGLAPTARARLVGLLVTLAPADPAAVVGELRAAAAGLLHLDPSLHAPFLGVAERLAGGTPSAARGWLREGTAALAALATEHRAPALHAAARTLAQHAEAPLALVQCSAAILRDAGAAAWQAWLAAGAELSGYAALAYHRRQSRRGAEVLRAARRQVALADIQAVLARYCSALAGGPIEVAAGAADAPSPLRGGGVVSEALRVSLPLALPAALRRPSPFACYKVMATHQVAHIEFGTYDFALGRPARYFATWRPAGRSGGLDAFLVLFPDPALACAIFTVLDDARVDALAIRQYAGLAADYRAVQRAERRARAEVTGLPPRSALLEALIRLSLGGRGSGLPATLRAFGDQLRRVLRVVERPGATVEDAAEATLR
ncbi:MAG: hypothetical protein HYU88_02990, partial [Chloroflexi bacterium]|nr:hypothetical protein [Chloroflexota bacterium]